MKWSFLVESPSGGRRLHGDGAGAPDTFLAFPWDPDIEGEVFGLPGILLWGNSIPWIWKEPPAEQADEGARLWRRVPGLVHFVLFSSSLAIQICLDLASTSNSDPSQPSKYQWVSGFVYFQIPHLQCNSIPCLSHFQVILLLCINLAPIPAYPSFLQISFSLFL